MTKKRSDALQALVAEVVDLGAVVDQSRDTEEVARQGFVASRQILDAARERLTVAERRLATTEEALRIIQQRDDVSAETIGALLERAGSPRTWA